ncbi:MAG: response regulator [Thermodesulfobacteria bacterium]|nr:response regulator [Thermodesulfobacteriota bacterium]
MDNSKRTDDSLLALMADLHHEIRSPVNTIMNMTELASREQISPSIKNYLKTIEKSANTLLTLLDDIIELSQDDLDAPHGNQGFSLTDLLEDVKETIDGPSRAKGAIITVSFKKDTPEWLSGPRGRIRQILTQILNYSMRQMGGQNLHISIGTESEPETEGERIFFDVLATKLQNPMSPQDILRNPRILICQRLLLELGDELKITEHHQGVKFRFAIAMEPLDIPWGKPIYPTPIACLVSTNGFSSTLIARRLAGCGFQVVESFSIDDAERTLEKDANSSQKRVALIDWELIQKQRAETDILKWNPGPYPVVFFDIPAINMMDISARLSDDNNGKSAKGFVMAPSKGRQIMLEVLRVLRMEKDQLSCPFLSQESDEEEVPLVSQQRQLQGMKVLVVEDDRINQRIVVELLKKFGIKPVVASTGKAAMSAVSRHTFDAIFMDINLPDSDGYILTKKIRSMKDYAHVPIIALTASTKNRKLCMEAGMDYFLSKPYSEAKLMKSLLATTKGQQN